MSELVEREYPIVDIFPYKIKSRNSFYCRDHPVNIRPDSVQYQDYWKDQIRRVIEGYWVYDVDTWVYMPAKLYFYVNITKIYDTDSDNKSARQLINPVLRDIEWIFGTYTLCAQGFSGFAEDYEYTCHETVG